MVSSKVSGPSSAADFPQSWIVDRAEVRCDVVTAREHAAVAVTISRAAKAAMSEMVAVEVLKGGRRIDHHPVTWAGGFANIRTFPVRIEMEVGCKDFDHVDRGWAVMRRTLENWTEVCGIWLDMVD